MYGKTHATSIAPLYRLYQAMSLHSQTLRVKSAQGGPSVAYRRFSGIGHPDSTLGEPGDLYYDQEQRRWLLRLQGGWERYSGDSGGSSCGQVHPDHAQLRFNPYRRKWGTPGAIRKDKSTKNKRIKEAASEDARNGT